MPSSLLRGLTMLPKNPALIIIAHCSAQSLMAIISSFSFSHMVWTLPQKPCLNYVRLNPRRLSRVIEKAVRQNNSTFCSRSIQPPKQVDYYFRTLRQDIFSKAYPRPVPYLDELQFHPTQQDVQQNRKLLDNTLYLEIKLTEPPDLEGATPSTFHPRSFS